MLKTDDAIFSTLVDTGAARSCISEHIRRQLHKVLTPPTEGYNLRMGNRKLVRPLGYCTASVRVGGNNHVIIPTVIAHSIADIILGCVVLTSTGAIIDCGNHQLHLSARCRRFDSVEHFSRSSVCRASSYVASAVYRCCDTVDKHDMDGSLGDSGTTSRPIHKNCLVMPNSVVDTSVDSILLWVTNIS